MSGGWRRQMGTRYWNCAGNYSWILVGHREQGEPCPNMNRKCGLNEAQRTWTLVPQKSVGLRKLLPSWPGREEGEGERDGSARCPWRDHVTSWALRRYTDTIMDSATHQLGLLCYISWFFWAPSYPFVKWVHPNNLARLQGLEEEMQ